MKHPKLLFGFFVVLGIIFLMLAIVGNYLNACDAVCILASFHSQLGFLLGGIVFVTVGIAGTGRHHFKNHRNLFTSLAAILVPLAVFGVFFVASWHMIFIAPMFPMRSEITRLTVVDTSPLVLSLNVKAITSRDTTIYGAVIRGLDGHAVTWQEKTIMTIYDEGTGRYLNQSQVELPAGSTKLLTLEFKETLPSGNYSVLLLGGMHYNHASSPFIIP